MSDVRVSKPGKVLFPDDGLTKADLVGYYRRFPDAGAAALELRELLEDGLGLTAFAKTTGRQGHPCARRAGPPGRVSAHEREPPDADPERRLPFSSRNLVACLRAGAERSGCDLPIRLSAFKT